MRKQLILFAVIMVFVPIKAQDVCPSVFHFNFVHETGMANFFRLKLVLDNYSQHLNAFNVSIEGPIMAKWAVVDQEQESYFSAKGYGKYILAQWEDKTDEEREAALSQLVDKYSNAHDNLLSISMIMKTNECLYFPTGMVEVGEFAIDLSDCEDGQYEISTDLDRCSFSYYENPEVIYSLTPSFVTMTLYKSGNLVSWNSGFPLDDFDGISVVQESKQVSSVRYYNLAGVESVEPQQGVNIKVTTYSDGTRKREKVLK